MPLSQTAHTPGKKPKHGRPEQDKKTHSLHDHIKSADQVEHKHPNQNFGHEAWEPEADLNAEEQENEAYVHGCATRKHSGYNF